MGQIFRSGVRILGLLCLSMATVPAQASETKAATPFDLLPVKGGPLISISAKGNAPNSRSSFPKPLYPGFRSETFSFQLNELGLAELSHGKLRLRFSSPDRGSHRILVRLNGVELGELGWGGSIGLRRATSDRANMDARWRQFAYFEHPRRKPGKGSHQFSRASHGRAQRPLTALETQSQDARNQPFIRDARLFGRLRKILSISELRIRIRL